MLENWEVGRGFCVSDQNSILPKGPGCASGWGLFHLLQFTSVFKIVLGFEI